MAKITANGNHALAHAKNERGSRFVLRSDGAILWSPLPGDGLRVLAQIKASIVIEGEKAVYDAFSRWCDRRHMAIVSSR